MDQSTEIQGKNISDKTIPKFSKTWIEYQKSMQLENPCFDSARRGDINALKQQIVSLKHLDEKSKRSHLIDVSCL